MFNSKDILTGGFSRRISALALALGLFSPSLAADINISTNWTLNSTFTLNEGANRVCMGGVINGGGKLVVNSPGGIRFDKSSPDWIGGIELQDGFLDPRQPMAFGTGQVLVYPNSGKKPYINLGLYAGTTVVSGAFTNDFRQIWEVAEGATDEDYSSDTASIQVGCDANTYKGGNHITWQGDMRFSDSAVMQVGTSETYSSDNQRLYVNGDVTLESGVGTLYLRTWGNFYFNGNLSAWRIYAGNAWSQKYTVYLNTPLLDVRQIVLYSSNFKLMENCPEEIPQLHWAWSWDSARYKLDVNGRSFKTPGLSFTERKGALQRFFSLNSSDSCSFTSGGPSVGNSVAGANAWLTLTGGLAYPRGYSEPIETNYTALVRFVDNISLRMDAYTNTCMQTLRLMPSTTKGAIDVNCGKLRIEAPCSFKNLTSIRVGKDGILETVLTNCPAPFEAFGITTVTNFVPYDGYVENIYNSVTNLEVNGRFLITDLAEADPLPNLKVLTLSPDARLELPAGTVLQLKHYIRYNARTGQYEEQPSGIYHPTEMVRGGTVVVDSGDTVDCIWTGTNSILSIDYGPNWKGYSGNDTPILRSGLAKPLFAELGTNAWFTGNVPLRGLRLKAPAGVAKGGGVRLMREPGANGANSVISLYGGGLSAEDGTSTTTANHRNHTIDIPVRVYQDQIWSIQQASSVSLLKGFSDDDMPGTRVSLATTGKSMALALFATNSLAADSSFVVPKGTTSNGGTLAITGAVHLAGAMVVSNGSVNLTGRLAGRRGQLNDAMPTLGGNGTFTYFQGSTTYRFTLDDAQIDAPMWMMPYSGGSLFYLTETGHNVVHAPMIVQSQTVKSSTAITLNTQGGEIIFSDLFMATNCIIKAQTANRIVCHVVFENRRYAENGGNRFWIYAPSAGLTEFNTPYNTFVDPDNGGLTFDYNNGTARFNVDLAVTNGTFRFNNYTEKNIYASFCDLGSSSQRIDRLVAVHTPGGLLNTASMFGDGAWLEIAGNGMSSTNGMVISNCVNIAKTGSSSLLFYDRDFYHTGELVVSGGLVEFATNATWKTSSRVVVNGPGSLKLDASERLSPHTQLKLATTYDPFDDSVTNLWSLVLPSGVTQSVASVSRDGSMMQGGFLGNTNFNPAVTWHDDRIEGAGVIKIARRGSVFRFR